MKLLFTIDLKDYDSNWEKFYRPSVRGIIFDNEGNIAMTYSRKCHFYKFPGGGIEGNETHLETLMREIREETGMRLIPESVREFGEVLKIQKGHEGGKNVIHVQENFYYTCEVESEIGNQELEDDEKQFDYALRFVPIEEAIATNAAFKSKNVFLEQMVKREKTVLEIIKNGMRKIYT